MKFLKRNQVIVLVIGLMLVTAGYLNFNNNKKESQADILQSTGALADSEQLAEIGDAQLVSTKPANDSDLTSQEEMKNEVTNTQSKQEVQEVQANNEEVQKENKEESTEASTNSTVNDEYFTKSRLERDTMYSQMLESYQKILDKTNISESQKTTAQNEIKKINELKNAIMITENLIKTKGFEDLIIFINDKSINVIVKSKELKKEQIAQIQNVITRELKSEISNIHISNKE